MNQGAEYYESADNVLHTFSPVKRFLSKYFPKDWFVIKCKSCKRIPSEVLNCVGKDNKQYYSCRNCYEND